MPLTTVSDLDGGSGSQCEHRAQLFLVLSSHSFSHSCQQMKRTFSVLLQYGSVIDLMSVLFYSSVIQER